MERFNCKFNRGIKPLFDAVPDEQSRQAIGVDCLHLRGQQSGGLFVTRDGWPRVESLFPSRLFTRQRLHNAGRALAGAAGASSAAMDGRSGRLLIANGSSRRADPEKFRNLSGSPRF